MRGASNMASLPCLMIIEQTRSSIIFAAIVLHERTILARPEWKIQPWRLYTERLDHGKKLFDILSDCPELFVLRDQLSQSIHDIRRTDAVHHLNTKTRRILSDLEQWNEAWLSDPSHTYTEIPAPPDIPVSMESNKQNIPMWSIIFQYQSLHHSNIVTMYNSALILVLQFLLSLDITTIGYEDTRYLQARMYEAGIIICRSVEYLYRQSNGEQGGFFLLFPLRMAYDAVERSSPAIEMWLRGVLDEIATGKRGMWKSAKTLLEIGVSGTRSTMTNGIDRPQHYNQWQCH
jgi:hypothetical protein